MKLLVFLNMAAGQLRDLFGGSLNEVMTKVFIAIITILWSIANDTAYLLFIFILLLGIDAILGAIVSVKNGKKFNAFRLITGPGLKLGITALVMLAMAVLDNLIHSTALGQIVTQPLVIGVGGAVCFAMGLDCVTKYATLSGNTWIVDKVRGMFGRMLPPVDKSAGDPPATV